MQDYKRPEKTIPRSPGIHEEWIAAIKAGKKSTTDFSYSGPLTEMMLLGNIALRVQGAKDRPGMGLGQDGVPELCPRPTSTCTWSTARAGRCSAAGGGP